MTDLQLRESLTDVDITALTVFGEARNQPIEGKVAVASVVRNRVEDPRWPSTYRAVCLQKWQFSCWLPEGGFANYETVMAAARTLKRGRMLPALRECVWVADGIIAGVLGDRVRGANHYLTAALLETHPPRWAKGQTPLLTLGAHVFFHL